MDLEIANRRSGGAVVPSSYQDLYASRRLQCPFYLYNLGGLEHHVDLQWVNTLSSFPPTFYFFFICFQCILEVGPGDGLRGENHSMPPCLQTCSPDALMGLGSNVKYLEQLDCH